MAEPTPTAPRIDPGYGVPGDGSGGELVPWSWAVERLVAARSYWLCTTRADGRPHALPVWGLWLDAAFWFSAGRRSVKVRNLLRAPEAVVHLESGDEVVVLEGHAELVEDVSALGRFCDAYEPKYALRPDLEALDAVVFRVTPAVALTWREADFPLSATRWAFPR